MGVDFVEHLSPWAAEKCHHFEGLHTKRHDDVAFTLRAILEKDATAFAEGLRRIHRSEHVRLTTLVVLSKIAYLIRNTKILTQRNIPTVPASSGWQTALPLMNWNSFGSALASLIANCKRIQSSMNRCFRAVPMKYFFFEMPQDFDVDDFIASWNG